jgi:2-iminobutanoate/2-iminopropanoate deaminase
VQTIRAPAPAFSYSQGIVSGGLLFISGQAPIDPVTRAVPEDFGDQVRQTLDNVAAIAEAAGARLADAVRVGVYLARLDDFEAMDAAYREYFEEPLPARTTVGAAIKGFDVEIDAVIAIRDDM